jgi:hypothetical protein
VSLSRTNYEAVAGIVAGVLPELPRPSDHWSQGFHEGRIEAVENVAAKLADYFAADNDRFDKVHFLKACGVEVVE